MRFSDQTDKLAPALVSVQAAIDTPKKNRTTVARSYKYGWADLAEVLNAARAPLEKAELAVIAGTSETESGSIVLTTRVMHTSGQWVECDYPIAGPGAHDHQEMGKAITYGRRYSLLALLRLAQEDDDAEASPKRRGSRSSSKKDDDASVQSAPSQEGTLSDRHLRVEKLLGKIAGAKTLDDLTTISRRASGLMKELAENDKEEHGRVTLAYATQRGALAADPSGG